MRGVPTASSRRCVDSRSAAHLESEWLQAGVTQLVECDLAKVDVAGSSPVSRSTSQAAVLPPVSRTKRVPVRPCLFGVLAR